MTRFRFRAPGSKRVRLIRSRGALFPTGALPIAKASRAERAANRQARERAVSELERDLADVLTSFRRGVTIAGAEAAVVAGDARVIVNPDVPNELEAELVAVLGQSLEESLEEGVGIGFRFAPPQFDGVPVALATEAAVAEIERQAASAALGITRATTDGIRAILQLGVTDQLAPVEVARRVGDLAGLLPRQVRAVENFRAAVTRRLVPTPEALTPAVQRVIDQEIERYRDRQLLYRGRLIAETETQDAITAGERAFWDRAVADGHVEADRVTKTWRTVWDSHVCPICEPLHGQVVPYSDVFVTSVGSKLGPTAHPRCRCYLEYAEIGQPSRRPDRGVRALEENQTRRFLEEGPLREDLQVARARVERIERRLRSMPRRLKRYERTREALASAQATASSIEQRLGELAA